MTIPVKPTADAVKAVGVSEISDASQFLKVTLIGTSTIGVTSQFEAITKERLLDPLAV